MPRSVFWINGFILRKLLYQCSNPNVRYSTGKTLDATVLVVRVFSAKSVGYLSDS
jgi:hypothetical protein